MAFNGAALALPVPTAAEASSVPVPPAPTVTVSFGDAGVLTAAFSVEGKPLSAPIPDDGASPGTDSHV